MGTMMLRTAPLLAISVICSEAVAADPFPKEMFAQLVIGDGKEQSKFAWPKEERFTHTWRSTGEVIRVLSLDATIRANDEVHRIEKLLVAAWPVDGIYRLDALSAPTREALELAENLLYSGGGWKLKSESIERPTLSFSSDRSTITASVRYLSPKLAPQRDAWIAWSYATTLLASDPPVDQEFTPPMGRCSMDTAPQEESAKYADKCYAEGRLGCYLQLQVRIMEDRFSRVAWSSYGEASHDTEVDRLSRAGIDAQRFLMGLSYQFAAEKPREEIWPWRLARAFNESKSSAQFEKALASIAGDESIDEYNRLRASITLAYRLLRLQGDARKPAEIKTKLAELPLSPASKMWLEGYLFSES